MDLDQETVNFSFVFKNLWQSTVVNLYYPQKTSIIGCHISYHLVRLLMLRCTTKRPVQYTHIGWTQTVTPFFYNEKIRKQWILKIDKINVEIHGKVGCNRACQALQLSK